MPFKSKRQQRWMFANHPGMAKRWAEHTPSIKSLPEEAGGEGKEDAVPAKQAAQREGSLMANLTFEEKVIDAFQVSAAALERAEAFDREKRAQSQEIAGLIPETLDSLIRNGRFEEADREKLASALHDPVKVLRILTKVAAHRNIEEANHLGGQVDRTGKTASATPNGRAKVAAHGSVDSPYCGGRTTQQKPSELALLRGLGLA